MTHLLAEATSLGLGDLTADVSVTAEPFFARHGFTVVDRRMPLRLGLDGQDVGMLGAARAWN